MKTPETVLEFFHSLVGKPAVFTLPQDDPLLGILVDYAEGFFLVRSEQDGSLVVLNQSLILMVAEYIAPITESTEEHRDESPSNTSVNTAFDGHGYGPDSPNGTFGG